MKKIFALTGFLLAATIIGCDSDGELNPNSPQTIRLPMGFIADPQYAPFYVAVDKGYYAAEGIEIAFDYSFETDGVALVGADELPFAIVSGEQVILARAQHLPVIYVMEWYQKYPIAVVSLADAGIQSPADLAGRKVGVPGFFGATYVGYAGLLSANGMALSDVDAQEIGFTQVETLLSGRVDAVVGYANNEPIQLAGRGEQINLLPVADAIDLVANGIITNESRVAEQPELVAAFVRATLRGLRDTLTDPDEAYQISKKFVDGLDDSRQPVLQASLEMWQAEPLGIIDGESWENAQRILLEIELLDAPLADIGAAYTNQFVIENQPE